jgi:hypothetical protein
VVAPKQPPVCLALSGPVEAMKLEEMMLLLQEGRREIEAALSVK